MLPDNVLLWTLYQQSKALGWETVWALTRLEITETEAEIMRECLAFMAAYEQQLRAEQAEQGR